MDYQSASEEEQIVRVAVRDRSGPVPVDDLIPSTVAMVRDSRDHADVRTGSSVRGAIDHALLCAQLADLRRVDPDDGAVTLDAALLALSGRLRLREGCTRSPEDVVEELWGAHFAPLPPGESGDRQDSEADQGKA